MAWLGLDSDVKTLDLHPARFNESYSLRRLMVPLTLANAGARPSCLRGYSIHVQMTTQV